MRDIRQKIEREPAPEGERNTLVRMTVGAGYWVTALLMTWWVLGLFGLPHHMAHPGFLLAISGAACCWVAALLLEVSTTPARVSSHLESQWMNTSFTPLDLPGDGEMSAAMAFLDPQVAHPAPSGRYKTFIAADHTHEHTYEHTHESVQ